MKLDDLLKDLKSPVADEGFSDRVMARIAAPPGSASPAHGRTALVAEIVLGLLTLACVVVCVIAMVRRGAVGALDKAVLHISVDALFNLLHPLTRGAGLWVLAAGLVYWSLQGEPDKETMVKGKVLN